MSARRLLIVLIVLYVMFIGGTAYAHTGALPDLIRFVVIAGPAAVWLARLLRSGRTLPHTPLDLILAAGVAWLLVSALSSQERRLSLEMIWPLLAGALAFYLLVDLLRRGWLPHFKAALLAVALVIVAISGVELLAWYFGWLGEPGWFAAGGLSDPIPPELPVLDWALNVSTIQGNTVAVLIPLVLTGAILRRGHKRVGLLGLMLALLAVEVLTFSRGGLLGALVGIALLLAFVVLRWAQRRERAALLLRPPVILGAIGLLVLGAGLLILVWSLGAQRADSDQGRLDIWRSAWEMAADQPVAGIGPGVFGLALRSYRDPDLAQDKITTAHNLWLNTLAETGWPGLLILLGGTAAVAIIWWRHWYAVATRTRWVTEAAADERRIGLEGALAALVAYGVHSLVDTFPLPASVLPLLLVLAYIVARPDTRAAANAPASLPIVRWRSRLMWLALDGIIVYGVWIAMLDVAQGWMTLSRRALAGDDLDGALTYARRAQAWDPDLTLYDLHEAYVLGRLADHDPGLYLDQAIAAHESVLRAQPTFDLGWANLAALYMQQGHLEAAREALAQAAAIDPSNAIYWFRLGDYPQALEREPTLAETVAEIGPAGLRRYLEDERLPVGERLYVAVLAGVGDVADDLAPRAEREGGWLAHLALGMYAHRLQDDPDVALTWLTQAISERPVDERAALERAELYLEQGDLDAATHDAHAARFVDPNGGAPGAYYLARIALARGAGDAEVEALLKASRSVRPNIQYFAGTVYARPAAFDYLPQLRAPGLDNRAYAGWLLLAERYIAQGRVDDARQVYRNLLLAQPYLDEARIALARLADFEEE